MRERIALALLLTGLIAWATGCKKQVDQAEFKSAINQSFAGRHVCVWSEPIKLPVQADTSSDDKTRDYDALTDAGLFIRGSAEKKRFLVGSKQVNDYDLSGTRDAPPGLPTPQPARLTATSASATLQRHRHRQRHSWAPQRPLQPHVSIHRQLPLGLRSKASPPGPAPPNR